MSCRQLAPQFAEKALPMSVSLSLSLSLSLPLSLSLSLPLSLSLSLSLRVRLSVGAAPESEWFLTILTYFFGTFFVHVFRQTVSLLFSVVINLYRRCRLGVGGKIDFSISLDSL